MSKKKKHIQTEKDFIGKRLPAIVFPFGAVFYALGVRLLLREKGGSFVKRLLRIWVPLFAWCAASVLLFWAGIPKDGFGAVFSRVEGGGRLRRRCGHCALCHVP